MVTYRGYVIAPRVGNSGWIILGYDAVFATLAEAKKLVDELADLDDETC